MITHRLPLALLGVLVGSTGCVHVGPGGGLVVATKGRGEAAGSQFLIRTSTADGARLRRFEEALRNRLVKPFTLPLWEAATSALEQPIPIERVALEQATPRGGPALGTKGPFLFPEEDQIPEDHWILGHVGVHTRGAIPTIAGRLEDEEWPSYVRVRLSMLFVWCDYRWRYSDHVKVFGEAYWERAYEEILAAAEDAGLGVAFQLENGKSASTTPAPGPASSPR